MAVPVPRTVTAEELFALPDDDCRRELVDGVVVTMSPTGAAHGVVSVRIGRLLDEHVSAHGLGVCCGAETGFILRRNPDVVRAPAAAFVAARVFGVDDTLTGGDLLPGFQCEVRRLFP